MSDRRGPVEALGRRARDSFGAIAVDLLLRSVRQIEYPTASAWAARVAPLVHLAARSHRRRAFENLRRAFGNEKSQVELESLVRTFFDGFVRNAAEVATFGALSPEQQKQWVQVEGMEKLRAARASGRGVIALSAHLGNFLIMNGRLALEGLPVDLLLKPMRDPRIEARMESLREELGYHSIPVKPRIQSARASLRSLKQDRVLVVLGDQRPKQDGIDVTFFGIPAKAAPGPISLALSTGAPIVPMFMVRNDDRTSHTLVIEDPIELRVTGSKARDLSLNAQKYTDVIESYVRRYPEQWMWGHERWGRRAALAAEGRGEGPRGLDRSD